MIADGLSGTNGEWLKALLRVEEAKPRWGRWPAPGAWRGVDGGNHDRRRWDYDGIGRWETLRRPRKQKRQKVRVKWPKAPVAKKQGETRQERRQRHLDVLEGILGWPVKSQEAVIMSLTRFFREVKKFDRGWLQHELRQLAMKDDRVKGFLSGAKGQS